MSISKGSLSQPAPAGLACGPRSPPSHLSLRPTRRVAWLCPPAGPSSSGSVCLRLAHPTQLALCASCPRLCLCKLQRIFPSPSLSVCRLVSVCLWAQAELPGKTEATGLTAQGQMSNGPRLSTQCEACVQLGSGLSKRYAWWGRPEHPSAPSPTGLPLGPEGSLAPVTESQAPGPDRPHGIHAQRKGSWGCWGFSLRSDVGA